MDWPVFFNSNTFIYVILPILIFCSRIVDVSIGTMRVIFVTKGYRWLAPFCGFFEVLIWLIAVTQIMKNLSNVFCYIAYAGGFATGNFVGMYIEQHMALGTVLIRVITKNEAQELLDYFKSRNYGVTVVDAEGLFDKVKILFTVIKRSDIPDVIDSIKRFNPQAFYTIEDVRFVNEDSYTLRNPLGEKKKGWFQDIRKWK
ncbi:MAG: DUF2179 domain-containing protein [Candidatus Latescibacter sp.]|nr:DUF2179 domain-containing protein [Candidatus Latescibacter sp.]